MDLNNSADGQTSQPRHKHDLLGPDNNAPIKERYKPAAAVILTVNHYSLHGSGTKSKSLNQVLSPKR